MCKSDFVLVLIYMYCIYYRHNNETQKELNMTRVWKVQTIAGKYNESLVGDFKTFREALEAMKVGTYRHETI